MIKLSNKQSWAGFALACAAFLCWKTVFVPTSGVSFSQSMNPTIQVGDFGLINQFAYGDTANDVLKNIRRGDVISFTHLTDGQQHGVAKRVIGLPNDNIQLRKGALYLNGVKITKGIIDTRDDMLILKEQIGDVSYYVQYNMRLKEGNSNDLRNGEWTVPEGKLFVVGDNRDHSLDSRSHRFGYAEIAKVKGRFETIMWNTNELSSFRLNRISCPLYETKDYFPNDLSCVSRQSRVHNTDSLLAIFSAGLK